MGPPKIKTLAILPLPSDAVLLPGITLRIPVENRPDIPALLSSVYTQAVTPKADASAISIGCVPLSSPLLSPDGQNLLDDGERKSRRRANTFDVSPAKATKEDLFTYGTVAKISGVQGRRPGELALIVEGVRRFRIDRVTQDRPYFEAEVTYHDEEGLYSRKENGEKLCGLLTMERYSYRAYGCYYCGTFRSTQTTFKRTPYLRPTVFASTQVIDEPFATASTSVGAVHIKKGYTRGGRISRLHDKCH